MIKSGLVLAVAAALMTASLAFSSEYMMCYTEDAKFTKVKYVNVICEGDNADHVNLIKLAELHAKGWKVDHMTSLLNGNTITSQFLMIKE